MENQNLERDEEFAKMRVKATLLRKELDIYNRNKGNNDKDE